MKAISAIIGDFSAEDIATLEQSGSFTIEVEGEPIILTIEDVEIISEDIPGWLVASEGKITVALDITITDDLRKEGIARDLVNRIQNLRKEMGLEVQDKITIEMEQNEALVNDAVSDFKAYICEETQALDYVIVDQLTGGAELEMDEFKIKLKIEV